MSRFRAIVSDVVDRVHEFAKKEDWTGMDEALKGAAESTIKLERLTWMRATYPFKSKLKNWSPSIGRIDLD